MAGLKYLAASVPLLFAATAWGDELPEFDGGDVVVTASGVPQSSALLPVNVSVITSEDIAASSAATVTDVLATAPGVHLINQGGSSPVIDLGGFGVAGTSNTLVLVDGVRQNTNDQSPPDLSYIPLSSVERIEIVRGSGAVAYGAGATGGVINIITRSGYQAGQSLTLTQTIGSYNLRETDANFRIAGRNVTLSGFGQSMNTDHYRDNAAERNDGGGLEADWKFDNSNLRLYARSDSDSQRFPGARKVYTDGSIDQYTEDTAGTSTPLNNGVVKTDIAGLQWDGRLGAGRLYLDFATRDKTTDGSYFSSSYNSFLHDLLNEDSGSARYVLPLAGRGQLMVGADWLSGDASGYSGSTSLSSATLASSAKQKHQALFTEWQTGLWRGATMTLGGRVQRIDDLVSCTDSSSGCYSSTTDTELHAWQVGLRQILGAEWSVFANAGQSFRVANVDDELYTAGTLLPQSSHDQTVGIAWQRQRNSASLSLFRSELSNEIQFMPYAGNAPYFGQNINLPPTRHQGLQFDGGVQLTDTLRLSGNLTWQQAIYQSGVFNGTAVSGKSIPMVPHWLATLGLGWQADAVDRLNIVASYTGTQWLDNDSANQGPARLGAYTLVDASWTRNFGKRVTAAFSINNLFNDRYATYGSWSSTTGTSAYQWYSLYPGDPRNYKLSVTVTFG
jgi:iron complex outermembrane receptor protein